MNVKDIIDKYIIQEQHILEIISERCADIDDFIEVKFNQDILDNEVVFKKKKVLYYFEIININDNSSIDICNKILTFKNKNKLPKLPKVNINNAELKGSRILYVGKSFGSFRQRIKQHLGKSSKKTYALHFNIWNNIFNKEVNLKLHFVSLDHIIKDNEDYLLEKYETAMHNELKPLLGRSGH